MPYFVGSCTFPTLRLVIFWHNLKNKAPDMRFLCLLLILSYSAIIQAQEEEPPYYIHSIYFGGGSYFIDEVQVEELNNWLDAIPNIENCEISIHGHTDDIGSVSYNQWLSKMRTDAALQRLLMKQIPEEIISIEEFGELNPVYDNSTWEGKLKNRRVDIIIKPILL
jgi:outer membrane protein OmpA-like peptidoglycan-associated protein